MKRTDMELEEQFIYVNLILAIGKTANELMKNIDDVQETVKNCDSIAFLLDIFYNEFDELIE